MKSDLDIKFGNELEGKEYTDEDSDKRYVERI